jgi:hypothetical protein
VDRAPAALVLTAPDLAEFVKFLPEVRGGTLSVQRLLFLAPLFVVAVSAPFVATARRLAYPGWTRAAILFAGVPLALLLLPPVWSPPVLLADEFRLQTAGCALCLVLTLFLWLRRGVVSSRRLSRLPWPPLALVLPPLALVLPLLWLAAPLLAWWQFAGVQAAISGAYAAPVPPGWGAWATLGGGIVMSTGLWLGRIHDHHG